MLKCYQQRSGACTPAVGAGIQLKVVCMLKTLQLVLVFDVHAKTLQRRSSTSAAAAAVHFATPCGAMVS
jgi:hypothetical protein